MGVLSLFGWTLGGVVALEYDDSPVGPYREYVSMGALVSKRGAIGQWGSRLYVSTQQAEDICRSTWGVPALCADIVFDDQGDGLRVQNAPDTKQSRAQIAVEGWDRTRVVEQDDKDSTRRNPPGGLPVFWTPTIKALWAPLIPLPGDDADEKALPLNRLRLSASALRLHLSRQEASEELGIPLGVGLSVDNVLIEISRRIGSL